MSLENAQVETLVTYMIRHRRVFAAAHQTLLPEHFNRPHEGVLKALWRLTLEYHERRNDLPALNYLSTEVVGMLQASPNSQPGEIDDANSLITYMFTAAENNPLPDETAEEMLAYLREFLIDRRVSDPLFEAYQQTGGRVEDVPALLQQVNEEMMHVNSVSSYPTGQAVPESWEGNHQPITPTTIDFLDCRIGGGQTAQETNVTLAPTGVGKTLLCIQKACAIAQQQEAIELSGGQPTLQVLISYELPLVQLQRRVMCCAAMIHSTTTRNMTSYDDLSRANNLKAYERGAISQTGDIIAGEWERLQRAKQWVDRYLRIIDFSGTPDESGVTYGRGGITEVRGLLDHLSREAEMPIGTLYLDWAGDAVRTELIAQNKDPAANQTAALGQYVSNVGRQISKPLGCTTWVAHQIRGSIGNRSPTTLPTHFDAEQCSSFAVNAAWAIVMGTKDMETETCLLGVTKTRDGSSMAPLIVKINGAFGRLDNAEDRYAIDSTSQRIMERSEAARMYTPDSGPVVGTNRGVDL